MSTLGAGKEEIWEHTSSNSTAFIGGRLFPRRFYENAPNGPGDRRTAYVMAAQVSPRDAGFWIGVAREIEGAGATPPPAVPEWLD